MPTWNTKSGDRASGLARDVDHHAVDAAAVAGVVGERGGAPAAAVLSVAMAASSAEPVELPLERRVVVEQLAADHAAGNRPAAAVHWRRWPRPSKHACHWRRLSTSTSPPDVPRGKHRHAIGGRIVAANPVVDLLAEEVFAGIVGWKPLTGGLATDRR